METVTKAVKVADQVLNLLIAIVLVLALLYGSYALWDTYQVYNSARTDKALLRYKPVFGKAGSNLGLSELTKLNPDVCAWITVDDTHIDYPVVRGTDNVKYVNTNVYGNYSLSGSIFLDSENDKGFSDFYSLLYGHHMEGGMMFGDIGSFPKADYFNSHTTGTLFLTDRTFDIEIFACLMADAYDSQVFQPEIKFEEEKTALLEYIRTTATQYREIGISTEDHIIGLSTCSSAVTNGRTIVFGRLREKAHITQEGSETTP